MTSSVQQASLEYGKAYIQQIGILHYIDFVKKQDDLNTVVYVLYFWKIPQFLQTYVISSNAK